MRRPKRIVHILVGERSQCRSERRVVLFFLGMEPQVLEQDDAAAAARSDRVLRGVADAILGEHHRAVQELREPIRHRAQAHLGIRFAFGAAQMAGENDRRAVNEGVLNGGQRGADARVVTDHALLQRDVEVDPDEDALVDEVKVGDRELHSPFFTSRRTRSTQRLE
jgi:hypothetical protein